MTYYRRRIRPLFRQSILILPLLMQAVSRLQWPLLQLYPVVDAYIFSQKHVLVHNPTRTGSYRSSTQRQSRDDNGYDIVTSVTPQKTTTGQKSSMHDHFNWNELDQQLQRCTSGTQARSVLEQTLLRRKNHPDPQVESKPSSTPVPYPYYQSIRIPAGASQKGLSDGDLSIQTRLIQSKYNIMEVIDLVGDNDSDRATAGIGLTFVISTTMAILINQSPIFVMGPDIVRFILVWMFVFAPLGLIGYGIRDAEALQTILMTIQQQVDPAYRQRMIQHEAGHFLMGHLLGWPIEGYSLRTTNMASAAVQFYPLSDPDIGKSYAQQLGFDRKSNSRIEAEADAKLQDKMKSALSNTPYFSKSGRGGSVVEQQSTLRNQTNQRSLNNQSRMLEDERNDPTTVWPYRGFSDETLDVLTMISVGGVCAEILAMGNAQGGRADFDQWKQFCLRASSSSDDHSAMSDREMNNRLRYALGFTMSVLRRHLHQLDALSAVMEQNGSIAQCIQAIETSSSTTTTTMATLSTGNAIDDMNRYELNRRERFRSQSPFWTNHQRSIDTVEDRWESGKGGGSRPKVFRVLTGDDPLYLAIAVAGGFLIWALAGGLSLH